MSKFEAQLITRLCDGGEWRGVKDQVGPEHFTLPDTQAAWRFGAKHAADTGIWPSRDVLRDHLPRFTFEPSTDAPTVLAERLHATHVYRLLVRDTDKIMTLAAADPLEAANQLVKVGVDMRTTLNRASGTTGINITQADQMLAEMERYLHRAEARGLVGWAWPWPILNDRTLGLEPGQMVTIYGRPKTGKTFLLQSLCEHFHFRYKVPVAFFSREMPAEQLRGRHVAMSAKVDYTRYMHGQLTPREMRSLEDAMDLLPELPPFFIDTAAGSGADAADEIIQKAMDVGAELIAVDGLYFYGDRDWEEIAKFTSRLKWHILNTYKKPLLASTQGARNKRSGGDDVAYGDSVFQDSDMLIKAVFDPESPNRVHMSTAGIRDGRPARWQTWMKPCVDFGQAAVEEDEDDVPTDGDAMPKEVMT